MKDLILISINTICIASHGIKVVHSKVKNSFGKHDYNALMLTIKWISFPVT